MVLHHTHADRRSPTATHLVALSETSSFHSSFSHSSPYLFIPSSAHNPILIGPYGSHSSSLSNVKYVPFFYLFFNKSTHAHFSTTAFPSSYQLHPCKRPSLWSLSSSTSHSSSSQSSNNKLEPSQQTKETKFVTTQASASISKAPVRKKNNSRNNNNDNNIIVHDENNTHGGNNISNSRNNNKNLTSTKKNSKFQDKKHTPNVTGKPTKPHDKKSLSIDSASSHSENEDPHNLYTPVAADPEKQLVDLTFKISRLGRKGEWRKALQVFQAAPTKNAYIYSAAITACSRSKRWRQARDLLQQMEDLNLKPDVVNYTSCIDAYSKAHKYEDAIALLNLMKEKGVLPNIYSYNSCISACARCGRFQEALLLIQQMKQNNIAPDVISYNSAISACERAGNWELALNLLESMAENSLQPNVISYSATISACEKAGQWELAIQLMYQMRAYNIEPNVFTYTSCIIACQKSGLWRMALKLLSEMKENDISPSNVSYNACIIACKENKQCDTALQLLNEMKESDDKDCRPDLVSLNTCLTACATDNRFNDMSDIWPLFDRFHIKPSLVTYKTFLNAYARNGDKDQALLWLNRMKEAKLAPNYSCYNACMTACYQVPREVLNLMQDMIDNAASPDKESYLIVISACERQRLYKSALNWINHMRQTKVLQPVFLKDRKNNFDHSWNQAVEHAIQLPDQLCDRDQYQHCLWNYGFDGFYSELMVTERNLQESAAIQPTILTTVFGLYHYEASGYWSKLRELLQSLNENNTSLDEYGLTHAIRILVKLDLLQDAVDLINKNQHLLLQLSWQEDASSFLACAYVSQQLNQHDFLNKLLRAPGALDLDPANINTTWKAHINSR